ncbi:hypothetical protein RASY3_09245 [Ruminococcus albus SY3]|uniref:Uncharacterized protein n=1 Tax=Ruminococcus albus SY3 TaxID=1341156 RepID=A0A011UHV8_RUMAL|nr:hypothetical protein [Ruminococcus albus]EXM40274.1 hypothetical protein RASY3_09245 [Ruminococcus albus SY3]
MFYYIKITSETGKEIEIDGRDGSDIQKFLKSVCVCVDTVDDNVSNRASNVLNRVNVKLDIDSKTNSICKDLMDWALASSGEDVYRLVHIDVYDDKQVIRSFDIQKMFVEDYEEDFNGERDCSADLKLIQQANNAKNFLHDTARL